VIMNAPRNVAEWRREALGAARLLQPQRHRDEGKARSAQQKHWGERMSRCPPAG
jgi:hypothetical protein